MQHTPAGSTLMRAQHTAKRRYRTKTKSLNEEAYCCSQKSIFNYIVTYGLELLKL
jgi:hypothetical protein